MALKKQHIITPKKSDSKKKLLNNDLKTKFNAPKQSIQKKRNEFGDNDAL